VNWKINGSLTVSTIEVDNVDPPCYPPYVKLTTTENRRMADNKWNSPPAIYVFVTVKPNGKNGLTEPFTGRVGTCQTEAEVASIIRKDLKAMGETFGGLFEPMNTSGRTYRAFRASWTELTINTK